MNCDRLSCLAHYNHQAVCLWLGQVIMLAHVKKHKTTPFCVRGEMGQGLYIYFSLILYRYTFL